MFVVCLCVATAENEVEKIINKEKINKEKSENSDEHAGHKESLPFGGASGNQSQPLKPSPPPAREFSALHASMLGHMVGGMCIALSLWSASQLDRHLLSCLYLCLCL